MAKKSPAKHISVKRNPLFQKETPLSFDNVSADELLELTSDQKQDSFMSKWQNAVNPYDTYPKVFRRGELAGDRVLHDVKLYYKKYVIESDWTEKKYVMVINTVFENRGLINAFTIDKMGKMFDNESLPAQVRLKRDQEGVKNE